MRARFLLTAALLFAMAASVSAQRYDDAADVLFFRTYSIEIGTGLPPFHMLFTPTRTYETELAQQGQAISSSGAFYPVASLTGVMRTNPRTEFTLTAGASWYHHGITQYSVFGTDPAGKPRYDLNDGTFAGWKDSEPVITAVFQWRHLCNPQNAFVVYTALGAGIPVSTFDQLVPLPSITPVAFRYDGGRLYAFAELTLGPVASLVHGGLGFHF